MRHLGILLLGSMAIAACASNNNTPPPASSDTVAQATDQPNKGPDFTPAASDGVAAAQADTRRSSSATSAANATSDPNVKPASANAANGASPGNNTWGNSAEGSSGVDPSTGNAAAAPVTRGTQPPATDADNTRVNKRDTHDGTLTPMDQGSSASDRKMTQQIRQAVMQDKSLSFTAKNVKIITINGKVTLRGPVKSEAERTAIEQAARRIAGGGAAVDSQLELAQ